MTIGSWILGMRISNMVYMQFNLAFLKGQKGRQKVRHAQCENSNTSDFDEIFYVLDAE